MSKFVAALLGIALLASCGSPAPPPAASLVATPVPAAPAPAPPPPAAALPPSDPSAVAAPRWIRSEISGIPVELVLFDSRSHRLLVADQPDGPGTRWPDARAAAGSLDGIAAVNAGFFTPLGAPLGRLVADGSSTGSINRASSLGSGFFIEDRSGTLALIRRERFTIARHALQSGPFLVENGRAVSGLSPVSSSARSFIANDGGSRWLIARSGACSLSQLADALASASVGGFRIQTALNLDGGRSSEIWASNAVRGGPAFSRPMWNRPVRNFLILVPRS